MDKPASEVGAWGVGSPDGQGLHVVESEFIAELLRFDSDHPQGIAVEPETQQLWSVEHGPMGGDEIKGYCFGSDCCWIADQRPGGIMAAHRLRYRYDHHYFWLIAALG